ncbi:MAG: acyl-CoA dehydratase activase-related protein [Chloroflexota bacterium]
MVRIGIPRALLYYQYYPMWQTFFQKLGASVVVSPETTQPMLEAGSSRVVAETCLPVKAFIGHAIYLADRCDRIFIPAIQSTRRKAYNCSKFLGLPDMTRAVVPEAPRMLEVDININRGRWYLYQGIYRLGAELTRNPIRVREAALEAWHTLLAHQDLAAQTGQTQSATQGGSGEKTDDAIALIGHPYLLYDEFLSHRLIPRINQLGYRVVTPETIPEAERERATTEVAGNTYWSYEGEIVGAGGYFLKSRVSGIIGIMAFGCGPDSLMMEVVRHRANKPESPPFMSLTLEEHTSEVGLVTRLEAFIDMIERRKLLRCG